jgi:hypothetical protein
MSSSSRVSIVFGVLLLVLGLLFMVPQFLGGSWAFIWPLIILLTGLMFFMGVFIGGKSVCGLAIPGSIVTMLGLILLVQNSFKLWDSWAYAWALVPASVGIGLYLHGKIGGFDTTRKVGKQMAIAGLTFFGIFGVLFEVGAFLLGRQSGNGFAWAAILILLGIYFIVRRSHTGSATSVEAFTGVTGSFTRLALHGLGDMDLTQGAVDELKVETSDAMRSYLRAEVKDGTLEIRFANDWWNFLDWIFVRWGPIKYQLTMQKVDAIGLHGAGNLHAGELSGESLELKQSGAGNIQIDSLTLSGAFTFKHSGAGNIEVGTLQAESLDGSMSGAGNVVVKGGKAAAHKISMSGAGNYEADQLESQDVSLHMSGMGNADVWATATLDVSMSGAGNASYRGEPAVTKHKSGLGNLEQIK